MSWSLLNHMAADDVGKLLDKYKDEYPPEVARGLSREKAEAVIHAALWAHSSRSGSTAMAYAMLNLYEALGLKNWTFDEEESDALNSFRRSKAPAPPAAQEKP